MKAGLLIALLLLAAPKQPDVEAPGTFWRKLPKPQRGDWLAVFPEEGQTFAEYRASNPTRGSERRTRIYLQPWLTRPPRDERVLERIGLYLNAWFARGVVQLAPAPIPARAYDRISSQYNVKTLAAQLILRLPEDALLLLAVTDRDLALGKLAFAHGWGSAEHRVGILSIRRIETGLDENLHRRRVLSLAAHEASHVLSLAHCTFYRCLMNGSRTLTEMDERPLQLCPVCRSKLCWNLEVDALRRYARLAEAASRIGLADEAGRFRRAADVTQSAAKS